MFSTVCVVDYCFYTGNTVAVFHVSVLGTTTLVDDPCAIQDCDLWLDTLWR